MNSIKTVFCIFFLLTIMRVNAQVDTAWTPSKTYSKEQLITDFNVLKSALTEAHPSLYRYSSKATIDSAFETAQNKLTWSMTEAEFWRVLQPIIAKIHSAHTNLYPSAAMVQWYNLHYANFLPPAFYVQGDSLFMVSRKKGDSLRHIRPVIKIDGLPAYKIIDSLKQYTSGEALSNQFVDFILQKNGLSRIYGQVFGYKPAYEVTVKDSLNAEKTLTLKAVALRYGASADRFKEFLDSAKNQLNKVVSVTYPEGMPSTAILKIKNFTYYNYFKGFHEGFFKRMEDDKIKNLVIDIRGNTGGLSSIGLDIIRYLTRGQCTQIESAQILRNKITFDNYVLKGASIDTLFKTTDKHQDYKFSIKYYNYVYSYPIYNFDKNVYVLIDKGTFSEASIFASSLKNQRKIVLVGEETGGAEAGSDGNFSIIKLPCSNMLLNLPRNWENTASAHPRSKRGLMPDVPVKIKLNPNSKEDDVMEKVKELILTTK